MITVCKALQLNKHAGCSKALQEEARVTAENRRKPRIIFSIADCNGHSSKWRKSFALATNIRIHNLCFIVVFHIDVPPPFTLETMLGRADDLITRPVENIPNHITISLHFYIISQYCALGEGRECIERKGAGCSNISGGYSSHKREANELARL